MLRRTMHARFSRALSAVSQWCRSQRRWKIVDQAQHLARIMFGHYAYHDKMRALSDFRHIMILVWLNVTTALAAGLRDAEKFVEHVLARNPVPVPWVVHSALRSANL